jgi:ribosomal protein L29
VEKRVFMEFEKLSNEELRALNDTQSQEAELEIRLSLTKLRMDIFSEKGKHTGKVRQLKKSLARVMTFKTERMKATKNP